MSLLGLLRACLLAGDEGGGCGCIGAGKTGLFGLAGNITREYGYWGNWSSVGKLGLRVEVAIRSAILYILLAK